MSARILVAGKPDAAADAIFASLGNEYDVRNTDGLETTGADTFVPALICLCPQSVDFQNEHAMTAVAVICRSTQAPLVVFAEKITEDQRQSLIRAGAVDVFTAPYFPEEIHRKIARFVRAELLGSEIHLLRRRVSRLSQYFSADVAEKIMTDKDADSVYGENLQATIFFLDIRNFTAISENVEPNLIAALLNRLYTDIMDLILTYKGSVNKIIGDALLATFGCPARSESDAANAVHCALAIRDTMKFFNATKPAYIQEDINIGMGIATGQVFAGTIGSYRKMDYTVIGDTVNIAARLEGLTKQTRFDLIIDRSTRDLAGEDIVTRRLKVNRVRGRTQPMEIFLVDGVTAVNTARKAEAVFF